jgi:hypothetical protein
MMYLFRNHIGVVRNRLAAGQLLLGASPAGNVLFTRAAVRAG